MTVYNIITAICLALLTASALYVIISIILKNRADRIDFIRSFKRGKCIAVFLIAIPLLSIGYIYNDGAVIDGILNGITNVIDFVVLKFKIDEVAALMSANLFYKITVYYCCVLVILNAVLFAFSFIGQQAWQLKNSLVRTFTRREKLLLFGNNENNISVYKSNKTFYASIVDKVSYRDGLELYKRKIAYLSLNDISVFTTKIFKQIAKNKDYTIVINTQDDEENLRICNVFIEKISALSAEQKELCFNRLRIYVFGDPKFEAVYCDTVSASYGCIRYKNKYQMLAMDFIDRYPLTKFMNEKHVDYSSALIKPDVDINVCMIGFGKPNRQILLTSVANNQFICNGEKGIEIKKVRYHIFDKDAAENNKNLNHLYYRFKNEYKDADEDDYLPFPDYPADEEYHRMDINSPQFYTDIRKIITKNPKDVNYIIVSFESDLENIDMAQKLVEKRREWGVENLVVFVRAVKSHSDYLIAKEQDVFFIGNEGECVYNIERIISDKIYKMAQMRNEIYDLEYDITHKKLSVLDEAAICRNRTTARKSWYLSKSQLERESSLYCCLSLQSKLNLMGLEYCKVEDNALTAMTEDEYMAYYAEDDLPDTHTYSLSVEGKKIIKYSLNFPASKRRNLAVLEHLRWNSFMLSKGIVPATKEQIVGETVLKDGKYKHTNGKNYALRRHGNLTTFEGLVEFRKMIAERDNADEAECDVIKYDYQLLDDAYWLLNNNGYKIVKRS
ncbi:MAG: hypothetical protein ACI4MN_05315 [Candidatus Coproplasma sp.]